MLAFKKKILFCNCPSSLEIAGHIVDFFQNEVK